MMKTISVNSKVSSGCCKPRITRLEGPYDGHRQRPYGSQAGHPGYCATGNGATKYSQFTPSRGTEGRAGVTPGRRDRAPARTDAQCDADCSRLPAATHSSQSCAEPVSPNSYIR